MIRGARWTCSVLALLLGLLHLGLTWPMYRAASLEALWFAGSGLAVVLGALCNVIALRGVSESGRWFVVLINLLTAGFFAAAWPLLPQPQVAVGGGLFAGLATLCAISPEQRSVA